MMTMDDITKQVRMCRQSAAKMLHKANVRKVSVPFAHGKKHYWHVTPAQLQEIKEAQYSPRKYHPDKITIEQGDALTRLEAALGLRQPAGGQNAHNG